MNNHTPKKEVTDIVLDEILEMNDEELDAAFNVLNLSSKTECKNLDTIYSEAHLSAKKQILISARKEIDASSTRKTTSTPQDSSDIKERLIDMMLKGLLPAELTMAFRDGTEITDEEALSIYKNLKELGVNMDDE